MARHKNGDEFGFTMPGRIETWEQAGVAVLMDIRDELQILNRLLHRSIERNTSKKRSAAKKRRKR